VTGETGIGTTAVGRRMSAVRSRDEIASEFLTQWDRRIKAERGEPVAENEDGSAKSIVDGIRQRHGKPQPTDSRQHSVRNS